MEAYQGALRVRLWPQKTSIQGRCEQSDSQSQETTSFKTFCICGPSFLVSFKIKKSHFSAPPLWVGLGNKKESKCKIMDFQFMVTIYHCCRHLCLAVLETQRGDCESSLHEAVRIEAGCCWLFSFTSFAIENLLPIYQINITHGGLCFLIYV